MSQKTLHRLIGAAVFIITILTYLATLQPSVSLWDCGEFIASAYRLQVPHPPGTPFFLILGRLFSMIPFAENIAFRVNAVSALSSAFTILFLYLIAVKLIENFRGKNEDNLIQAIGNYIAAAVGALSLAFSDTFWFNSVEAEVYAMATFFIAFVVWVLMLWNEKADETDNEKYLIFIAYLLGLSTGVHLMSVLAMVPIIMIVMFRKYISDEEQLKESAKIFIVHSVLIILLALIMWSALSDATPPRPEESAAVDGRFKIMVVVASLIFTIVFRKKIFTKNSFYLPIVIGGISLTILYPGIVKYLPNIISELGGDSLILSVILFLLLFAALGYLIYWSSKNNKQTIHLVAKCFLFALIGFTSYSMIIIRANQDTPINLNSPKTFSELVKYLNREQYGEFPTFKRRYSTEAHQMGIYREYSSDLDFFWSYQMNHMFNRYLLWNYVGRSDTHQDAGIDLSKYYAIPLFLGLLGLFFHFYRDWKMASVFLVMFIFLGYLTAFYQNQQQPQPRERDYFYVGAFFVYSIWIALGIRGLLTLITDYFGSKTFFKLAFVGVLVLSFIAIPFNMFSKNYNEHDRSRIYLPWDYAYNLLQSVAPNSIVFTNGDNDTFPLWYLQDVEGVRQDVTIANLSLLNTPWYIKQIKLPSPYGYGSVKMSLTNKQIERLRPQQYSTQEAAFPVSDKMIEEYNITDSSVVKTKKIKWMMKNPVTYGDVDAIRIQDLVAYDIIKSNIENRPVYYSVTCSDKSMLSLTQYLQLEGMALRIVPKKFSGSYSNLNTEVMKKQLLDTPETFSKDYQPGFLFRGLNDPDIFYDNTNQRLTQNYRNAYLKLALHYLKKNDYDQVNLILDKMEENIPHKLIKLDPRLLNDIGDIYLKAGNFERYQEIASEVEEYALTLLEQNPRNTNGDYNPYRMLISIYTNLKEYNKVIDILRRLEVYYPQDTQLKQMIQRYINLSISDSSEVTESKKLN